MGGEGSGGYRRSSWGSGCAGVPKRGVGLDQAARVQRRRSDAVTEGAAWCRTRTGGRSVGSSLGTPGGADRTSRAAGARVAFALSWFVMNPPPRNLGFGTMARGRDPGRKQRTRHVHPSTA